MGPDTLGLLLQGLSHVTVPSMVMIGLALVLLYLGIEKGYEPLLLLPIGAGCMLANLPLSPLIAEDGMLRVLYDMGIRNELFPLLIFIGIGALTDFGPLLENPRLVLLGAAGQFGIFLTLIAALLLGFTRPEAASIGIIGAIDGPTSIYVSGLLAPHLLGPITVFAISWADALVSRSTAPESFIRFPSISMPIRGVAKGTSVPTTSVTTMGNRMRVRRLSVRWLYGMRIRRSSLVVRRLMIGGRMMGTSDM